MPAFKVTVADTLRPGQDFVMCADDRQGAADDAVMYVSQIMQLHKERERHTRGAGDCDNRLGEAQ